jgi:glycosyltransferase involved in cell wall biosynthesis
MSSLDIDSKPSINKTKIDLCRIVIDTVFFNMAYSGISRVWETILANLETIPCVEIILLIRGKTIPTNIARSGFHTKYRIIHINEFSYQIMQQDVDYLNQLCKIHDWNYFISSYFTYCTVIPNILLIHDMIPEIFKLAVNQMWIQKDLAIRNASQFITISQTTKNDLVRFYPYIETENYPIHVIHNSIPLKLSQESESLSEYEHINNKSQVIFQNILSKYGIRPKKYFFTISTNSESYKNQELILSFLNKYKTELCQKLETNIPFIIITKNIPNPEGMLINGALLLSDVSDEVLQSLYSNAKAFINPSLYEGFGLPVFEAFSNQTPVIACKIPIYDELCPGTITFIENDIDDLWIKVNTIIKGNDTIQRRIASGKEVVFKYTIVKQIASYTNLFKSIAESHVNSYSGEPFINLIFQSYSESFADRRAELEHCIFANLANPHVKYIHDFATNPHATNYLPSAITIHPKYIHVSATESNNGSWLTYHTAFTYSSNLENIKKFGIYWGIINCDIFLDNAHSNWSLMRGWLNSGYFLAQSRHEFKPDTNDATMDPVFAKLLHSNTQDAWFYSTANGINIDNCNFHLGMLGCDNAIADRIISRGYKIINMPITFKIIHYDIAKGKTSTNYLDKHAQENNTKNKPKNTHPEREGQCLVPNYDALMGINGTIDIVAIINQLCGISNWEKYKLISEMFSTRVKIHNP